jgi:leucyl-tRNA synthetase
VSKGLKKDYDTTPIRVDINLVTNDRLDLEGFKAWRPDYRNAEFILENGEYVCGYAVEKMSKSMFNVVNPDDIVERYGADTLRLYEMFLGPLEQSKPWDTNGIDGVNRFLKKLWGMFEKAESAPAAEPTKEELKSIHKLIKKVTGDIEAFSYNTSVAAFMICLNELTALKSANLQVMDLFTRLLAPFAPFMAEEFWHRLGHQGSVCDAEWPKWNEEYLKENNKKYPVSFNGKVRYTIEVPADMPKEEVEKAAFADPAAQRWLDGKTPKKVIVVPGRIVNIVI